VLATTVWREVLGVDRATVIESIDFDEEADCVVVHVRPRRSSKRRSATTRKGNVWLEQILVECPWWAAARNKDGYLQAQFWQLARRNGKKRAAVAVGHSILVIAWHLLSYGCVYEDLGGDFFTKRDTDRARQRAIAQLEYLGDHVSLAQLA